MSEIKIMYQIKYPVETLYLEKRKEGGLFAISCHHLIVELCVIYSHNNKMDLVNYICIKQLFFIYLPMEQSSGSPRPAQRLMGEIKCMKTRLVLWEHQLTTRAVKEPTGSFTMMTCGIGKPMQRYFHVGTLCFILKALWIFTKVR